MLELELETPIELYLYAAIHDMETENDLGWFGTIRAFIDYCNLGEYCSYERVSAAISNLANNKFIKMYLGEDNQSYILHTNRKKLLLEEDPTASDNLGTEQDLQ